MQHGARAVDTAVLGREPCYRDPDLTLTPMWDRPGLWVSGEIDASNAEYVAAAIAELSIDADALLVDVSRLVFADVAGVRALISPAERETDPIVVVLLDPPPILERVLQCGWASPPLVELRRS